MSFDNIEIKNAEQIKIEEVPLATMPVRTIRGKYSQLHRTIQIALEKVTDKDQCLKIDCSAYKKSNSVMSSIKNFVRYKMKGWHTRTVPLEYLIYIYRDEDKEKK